MRAPASAQPVLAQACGACPAYLVIVQIGPVYLLSLYLSNWGPSVTEPALRGHAGVAPKENPADARTSREQSMGQRVVATRIALVGESVSCQVYVYIVAA